MKTYHLFISHSWGYSDNYEKLVALLPGEILLPVWRLLGTSQ